LKSSPGHDCSGSREFTSKAVAASCLLKNSIRLRLKICDRVTSCLAQKASTAASIVLGRRKPVVGSDICNVFLLGINGGRYVLGLVSSLISGRDITVSGQAISPQPSSMAKPPWLHQRDKPDKAIYLWIYLCSETNKPSSVGSTIPPRLLSQHGYLTQYFSKPQLLWVQTPGKRDVRCALWASNSPISVAQETRAVLLNHQFSVSGFGRREGWASLRFLL
jgi:hypothetical protein